MTLDELHNILSNLNIPVAYSHFKTSVTPPYICYLCNDDNNFIADNKVYKKINNIDIELYTSKKDIEIESKLENFLDSNNLPYSSDETYIESEEVFKKIYTIGVI